MRHQRLLLCAVLAVLGAALTPATAAAGSPPTRDEAVQAGREAYLYGFPLIDFLRIRRENTSVKAPDKRGNAPVNFFSHAPAFAEPRDRTVVAPNVDTLYSIAQVDLGKGPIVLSHPGMGKRYFVFELVDPYTNVVGYVGSRTTGSEARPLRADLDPPQEREAAARRAHGALALPAPVGHRPHAGERHARRHQARTRGCSAVLAHPARPAGRPAEAAAGGPAGR